MDKGSTRPAPCDMAIKQHKAYIGISISLDQVLEAKRQLFNPIELDWVGV